ncbi:MAG: methionyl-tRNA formyltransferase [Bifidobacteriaceae bacterium]|jgi:methionyl-tRNA formyltransferase|nr:methionyl-tRNA formyltransferase [Bifidobacteriaceae bacterium]
MSLRLLFAGTPEVAVPSLRALAERFEVAAVLTRPDAVRGRGRKATPSPVKAAAEELGIPVFESKPSDPEFLKAVADQKIDAAAVVAYGRILKQRTLDAVPKGWYNLHFSLLPQWRGAAPAQRAIWAGDKVTGLTVFKITAGMDSGPIVAQRRVPLEGRPTSGELLESLAGVGTDVFVRAFEGIEDGTATFTPQPDFADKDHAYAAKITVEDAHADFALPAGVVDRRIRACNPDPGAWCTLRDGSNADSGGSGSSDSAGDGADGADDGVKMRLNAVTPTTASDPALASALEIQGLELADLAPGSLVVSKKHVWVVCGKDLLELNNVTAQGRKPMRAADWARGAHLSERARLG